MRKETEILKQLTGPGLIRVIQWITIGLFALGILMGCSQGNGRRVNEPPQYSPEAIGDCYEAVMDLRERVDSLERMLARPDTVYQKHGLPPVGGRYPWQ